MTVIVQYCAVYFSATAVILIVLLIFIQFLIQSSFLNNNSWFSFEYVLFLFYQF